MSSLLALAWLVSGAAVAADAEMQWSWGEGVHHRYYIESEVHLPVPIMLVAELNTEARMIAVQTQLVIDCTQAREGRKDWDLECDINDISLIGAGMTGDQGNLAVVLQEIDERLTSARLQVTLKRDGRIGAVDLEDIDRRNRRLSQNAEHLRLLLVRALSGLDFRFANNATDEGTGWPQFDGQLMKVPYSRGSQGSGQMVHKVRRKEGNNWLIDTEGRGSAAPASGQASGAPNTYIMEMTAVGRFDVERGVWTQRKWTVIGEPTAGSAVNAGFDGASYLQAGSFVYLPEGEAPPTLNESGQSNAPGVEGPSSLQQWVPIQSLGM